MKFFGKILCATALTFLVPSGPIRAKEATPTVRAPAQPNFLVIVVDDMGWSDLGAFGSEISTPNLDRLALAGIRLTGFHTAATCSPTRSMLLSGVDNHLNGLGSMAEQMADNQRGRPGYEGFLRADVATVAERLGEGGYQTLFSGKWHLGLEPGQDPHARGFGSSFALLQGGHNHFGRGLNLTRGKPTNYSENGALVTELPTDFYSSDFFATKLIGQLNGADRGKPFFAYLAMTAPHRPLQAPADVIAKYKGRYDGGYDAVRNQRIAKQRSLGLIADRPFRFEGPNWADLTAEQRQIEARKMEVHAAMIDRMDQNIGRVIDALEANGQLDNTVVLFLSDNGAEGLDAENSSTQTFKKAFESADNSLGNIGAATSYTTIGPAWAQALSAPSWLYKAYPTEGGTRTTAFISAPFLPRKGTIEGTYLNVIDVTPTLLDWAGVKASSEVRGRAVQAMTGKSWMPWLRGNAKRVYGPKESIAQELFRGRSVRQGDWKLVDRTGAGPWLLFNIAMDPGETADLTAAQPAKTRRTIKAWDAYAKRVGVVIGDDTQLRLK